MDFIENLRTLFPKAGFMISDGVLSMVFVNKDMNCTTQEICNANNNKDVFVGFLENARKLNIAIQPEKLIARMDFYSEAYTNNSGISYFFPIEKDISADELEKILEENFGDYDCGEYDFDIPFELHRFFKDVDFNDESQVSEALKKWHDETQPEDNKKIMVFSYIKKWANFRKIMVEFQKKMPWVDLEIEDPDEYSDTGCGVFNFCVSDGTSNAVLEGENLACFEEIIKQAELIVIESENDTEVSMSLTVFP